MDLKTVSKAIAGALAALLVGFLAKQGVTVSDEVNGALSVIIDGTLVALIGFLTVYFAPKNK